VDSAFDQDESELGVLVLSELLEMFANIHCLLNQVVEVFWNFRAEARLLEHSKNSASCDSFDLWDTEVISENDTDLGRVAALLCKFDDLSNKVIGRQLHPARWARSIWQASAGNTLAF